MTEPPQEFKNHIDKITELADHIEDRSVRIELLDAIEVLVHGMNGPWKGARVGWRHEEIPDDLSGLEGLF